MSERQEISFEQHVLEVTGLHTSDYFGVAVRPSPADARKMLREAFGDAGLASHLESALLVLADDFENGKIPGRRRRRFARKRKQKGTR